MKLHVFPRGALLLCTLAALRCSSPAQAPQPGPDAGPDAGPDGGPDAGPGDGPDGGYDAGGLPGTMGSNGPFTTYFGGTGSGSLTGGPVTDPAPQTQPADVPPGTLLFVTQVPNNGFSTVSSSFSNHLADVSAAPRGGDLMLRYPDGTLRNLTQEAGYGQSGMQGDNSIAVRDPAVHWSATKALFSMVVGAPKRYGIGSYYWQIYEVTGLGKGATASVHLVGGQPAQADNVSPIYGTDGRIIFTSSLVPFDLGGHRLDEYEIAPSVTGLWSLDPATGNLAILFNAPSGAFDPMIDSYGRVLWTNWDHLQRDQQSDSNPVLATYHPVDCTDEKGTTSCRDLTINATAGDSPASIEMFPEPRVIQQDNPAHYEGHGFNQFFPWMMNEDGTGAETLNHVGAHELGTAYQPPAFDNDASLTDISTIELDTTLHANTLFLRGQSGLFKFVEDPTHPGRYYFHYAPEFHSMNGGDLGVLDAAPGVNPEVMQLELLTNTGIFPGEDAAREGHYRDAVPLASGALLASFTAEVQSDAGQKFADAAAAQQALLAAGMPYGGQSAVAAIYDYHLVTMTTGAGGYLTAGARLIPAGISKSLTWYDPDQLVTYSGPLWELQAVEVRARTVPARHVDPASPATVSVFAEAGVDEAALRAWLVANDLALLTSYDVTQRDRADKLQPYNLEVKDADTGAVGARSVVGNATARDISYLQFVQGDALRAFRGYGAGAPVVRERYWVTFAAGEIRTCTNCHGINTKSQTGASAPTNEPAALRKLLTAWKAGH